MDVQVINAKQMGLKNTTQVHVTETERVVEQS